MTQADRPAASFDAFVASRGPALWRSAWLLTGDSGRAEDLVQTALAACYGRFERLGDGFEAYVRRSMYHTYCSWWRRKWRAEVPTGRLPETASTDDHAHLDLARALAELPRAQRAVIVLRYFDDQTEAQTADHLGISVGTVKSHASRALASLRRSPHLSEEP